MPIKGRKSKSGKTPSHHQNKCVTKNKNSRNEPSFISDDLAEGSREQVDKSLEHSR